MDRLNIEQKYEIKNTMETTENTLVTDYKDIEMPK